MSVLRRPFVAVTVIACVFLVAPPVQAQELPWWEFQDAESGIICGLVHAANVNLVVLQSSGELMVATPPNNILPDVEVDEVFNVYFAGDFVGSIAFAEDADGDRALFWLTITGRLVEVGDFGASPSASDLLPGDVSGTGCDACARYPSLPGCAPGDDDNGDDAAAAALTSLCGAGSGAAATLTLAFLLAGQSVRTARRARD